MQYETLLHGNSRSFAYEMHHRSLIMRFSIKQSHYKKSTDHALYKLLTCKHIRFNASENLSFKSNYSDDDHRRSQALSSHRLLFLFSPRHLARPLPMPTTPYSSVYLHISNAPTTGAKFHAQKPNKSRHIPTPSP